jgi:excisionase family DNA binding protein
MSNTRTRSDTEAPTIRALLMEAGRALHPDADPGLPPVCTVEQAAAFYQCHPKTVIRMLEDGRLKGVRTFPGRGGRWRIRREDVIGFLSPGAEVAP